MFRAIQVDITEVGDSPAPARSTAVRALLEGWAWLAALRLVLGCTLVAYAVSFDALPGHPANWYTEPVALVLAGAMVLTAVLQLLPSHRSSAGLARVGLATDLLAVFGTLALYAFDPRPNLLILIAAVQAEAGVVLGVAGALWVWLFSSGAYVGIELFSLHLSGASLSAIDMAMRILVGFVLAVGGGILWGELSQERRQAQEEREREVRRLHRLVRRLRLAEQRYRALVEQTPALLYMDLPDERQTPVYIGPRVESMFGVSREEILSSAEAWDSLVHPDDREEVVRGYADAVRAGRPYTHEYRVVRRDGATRWVHDEAVVLRDGRGKPSLVHGVILDITERRAADERDARERTYAEALRETAVSVMQRLEPADVLDTILGRAAALVGTTHGYVYLVDAERGDLEVTAGMGLFKEWIGFRLERGEGMAGQVVETGLPLAVDDYDAWEGRAAAFPQHVFAAVLGVPLASANGVTGVIGLAHVEKGRPFTADDVSILTKFAEIASIAVDNAQLYAAAQEELIQRKNAEAQLAHLAYHDRLTNLPNRAMFEELLELALTRAQRGGHAVAVLYLDLDNFKLINDSLGHNAGDELLKLLGARLSRVLRASDAVARQGGDEFLFLLANIGGGRALDDPVDAVTRAEAVADRIRDQLAKPFRFNGTDVYVSASIGIAICPFHATDARTLLRYADVAMYASKRASPGSTRVFSGEDPVGRLSLATRVRKAIDGEQFVLHYQPIVNLISGKLVGLEALIRWPQPDGSVVLPDTFLPVIEEMGLIGAVGEWVLSRVSEQARQWHERGATVFTSWNLSLPQLWQRDLAAHMMRTIRTAGAEPSSIVIEISESAVMSDPGRSRHILEELHDQGLQLALDDFGTGYSSLSRLKDLPVDILKIDRPFLHGLPEDAAAAASVRAIVQLADGLGMRALAEGIEDEAQRRYLIENGCPLGQGFLFSQALPAAALVDWMSSGRSPLPAPSSRQPT
jgi:diguanylate cyclase (GGDEF)-like protein/PAS domain S-box-containing protein